jgi:Phage minor structural protein GP20
MVGFLLERLMPILNLMKKHRLFEGDPGNTGGAGGTPPTPPNPQTFSHEYVRELREENKKWRLQHEEATGKAKAAEEAAAKAKADADAASATHKTAADERVIRAELKAVAIKAGMVDIDGLKLADLSTVKLDDKGEVVGADALIEALKKAKPYLFGSTQSSSTPNTPPSGTPPAAKKAMEMTDAEYAVARKAIK